MSPNDSFRTEQEADAFLRSKLDHGWLKRPQTPDFHVDYVVEMDDSRGPSGEKFAIQLKGTRSPKYVGEELTFRLRSDHLKYFVDRSPEPVFLVVVDLVAQEGYWLFVQRYEKERLDDWREQETTTVRVSRDNKLGDSERLREEVREAVAYMRDLRPGTVGAAASHLEETLESLDKRFDVRVSHSDALTRVQLHPREMVDAALQFRTPEALEKFEHLRATGKPVDFSEDELHFVGSPIFDEIRRRTGDSGMSLQSARRVDCVCAVFERRGPNDEVPVGPQLSGTMVAGQREARLEISCGGTPLSMRLEMAFGERSEITRLSFGLNFAFDAWVGQDLVLASHFDRVAALVRGLADATPLGISCEAEGNLMFKASISVKERENLQGMDAVLSVLEKARSVARHLGVRPKMPPIPQLIDAEQHVLDLWVLVDKGQVVERAVNGSGKLLVSDAAEAQKGLERMAESGEFLERRSEEAVSAFLDAPVTDWVIVKRVTGLQLTAESRMRLSSAATQGSGPLEVEIECSERSEYHTSLERIPPARPPA